MLHLHARRGVLRAGHAARRFRLKRRIPLCFDLALSNMRYNLPSVQRGVRGMDELVDRIAANVGVDRAVAEKAVGIIFDFLAREGPADKVRALLDRLPGADTAIQSARQGGSGMFGAMSGIMGVGSRLMSAGLGMGEIQSVTREVIAFAREKAGDDATNELIDAIPGLSQFI